jgi:hypothetical protein
LYAVFGDGMPYQIERAGVPPPLLERWAPSIPLAAYPRVVAAGQCCGASERSGLSAFSRAAGLADREEC